MCFSGRFGFISGTVLADGEIDMVQAHSGAVVSGQRVGEKVQSGSQVVRGVPDEQTDIIGDRPALIKKKSGEVLFDVILGSERIGILSKEIPRRSFEIIDVMVGACDF